MQSLDNSRTASDGAARAPSLDDLFRRSVARRPEAEALVTRPWEVVIRKDGKVVATHRPCWGEARCAAKERILASLLGQ